MVVITGSNGFTGAYLSKYIKEIDRKSFNIGIDIQNESLNPCIDRYFSTYEFYKFRKMIINTDDSVKIFHLGGLIGKCDLSELIEANVLWTLRYLEVYKELKKPECFINVGSSAEYGKQPNELLNERLVPNPVSNYGLSKQLQSQLTRFIGLNSKGYVICTRTFNLIGPGLSKSLVVGKLVNEFLAVSSGKKDFIEIGRLDSYRDFIDVRDVVKYYYLISETKPPVEFLNIATGKSHSIEEIMNIISRIIAIEPRIQQYSNIEYHGDIDIQKADISYLEFLYPEIKCREISESITEMIDYERR